MSCEIIDFSARAAQRQPLIEPPTEGTAIGDSILTPRQRRRAGKPELPPPATETAKNARIRIERRDAWWLVEREAEYWQARFKWRNELGTAQRYKIGDSGSFPPADSRFDAFDAVGKWREAVAKQLITPAPTLAVVARKRARGQVG